MIPTYQPAGSADGQYQSARKKNSTVDGDSQKRNGEQGNRTKAAQGQRPSNTKKRPERGQILTQHTGLPPRETGDKKPFGGNAKGKSKPKNKA